MTKTQIENAGLSGLPVGFADVARVGRRGSARGGLAVTLRHVWPEDVDGRIWSAVRRAYALGSQALANRAGRSVEVYSVHGHVIAVYEPEPGGTEVAP